MKDTFQSFLEASPIRGTVDFISLKIISGKVFINWYQIISKESFGSNQLIFFLLLYHGRIVTAPKNKTKTKVKFQS